MNRAVFLSLSLAFVGCLTSNPGKAPAPPQNAPVATAPLPTTAAKPAVVLGYSASWADGAYPPSAYDYTGITHVARSFLLPHADGSVTFGSDFWSDELEKGAHAHGVKLLASVGGAAENANEWLGMARSDTSKKRFFDSLEALITEHHYDGVDIDWEPSALTDADQQAYTSFMVSLRQRFPSWQITTALGASDWWARHVSWKEVAASVDFINVMTYTFSGPWSGRSGHNANLFPASTYRESGVDVDVMIRGLLEKYRVPPDKLVLGLAFYATQYSTDRMGQSFAPGMRYRGVELGYAQAARLSTSPEYNLLRDEGGHVPYLERVTGGHTLSFDDPRSISEKCVYAVQKGLRGVMFWYMGADLVRGVPVLQRALEKTYGLAAPEPSLAYLRSVHAAEVAESERLGTELERELRDLERGDPAARAKISPPVVNAAPLAPQADLRAVNAALLDVDRQLARLEIARADVQRALAAAPAAKGRTLAFTGPTLRVADFEATGTAHDLSGVWTASFDKNGLGTVFNPEPLAWSNDGHASKHALRLWGHFGKSRAPWPFAALVADFEATDFTVVKALRFWAKGNGKRYSASLHRLAVHDYAFPALSFPVTAEWSQIELPLATFKQPAWGQKVDSAFTDVNGIAFQPAPEFDDEDFDLSVDDLELVKR